MGMPGLCSRSSYDKYEEVKANKYKDEKLTTTEYSSGNPNPGRFRIDRHEEIGDYLVLLVVYPDCRNYEGKKVMVFKDLKWAQINKFKTIDPHFSNNKEMTSPIARFEPTIIGWTHAKMFCKMLMAL